MEAHNELNIGEVRSDGEDSNEVLKLRVKGILVDERVLRLDTNDGLGEKPVGEGAIKEVSFIPATEDDVLETMLELEVGDEDVKISGVKDVTRDEVLVDCDEDGLRARLVLEVLVDVLTTLE